MDPAYYVAAGSLKARSFQLDVVSNNLANAATVGYKPEKSFYSIYNKAKADGRGLPLSGYVNEGTVVAQSGVDFAQGPRKNTGHSLDLAIEGNAFFLVKNAQGTTQATRDGRFQIGSNGQLQALDGAALLGKDGLPIQIDPAGGPLKVLADGSVQQNENPVGQIDLRAFTNTDGLQRAGANRFDLGGARTGTANASVVQGALEESGVDMASCMIDMIRLNRLFEMSMKVASTVTNDMDAKSISDISTGR